jgi:hypothetical protein
MPPRIRPNLRFQDPESWHSKATEKEFSYDSSVNTLSTIYTILEERYSQAFGASTKLSDCEQNMNSGNASSDISMSNPTALLASIQTVGDQLRETRRELDSAETKDHELKALADTICDQSCHYSNLILDLEEANTERERSLYAALSRMFMDLAPSIDQTQAPVKPKAPKSVSAFWNALRLEQGY